MTQNPLYSLTTQNGSNDSSLLRTLIDSLPEQIYVKDTEGRYLLNNTGHARALGAESPEKFAGKSDFDFYPRKFAERYRADEQEIFRSGKPLVNKEEPSVDGEGNERWHSTTKVPLRDESGKIVGLLGITRDVTERTEAEEVLRESEDRFRSLTNAAFEGIVITENGEIVEANQAFADMYGYELSEVQGMSALEFQAPETRDEVRQKISFEYDQPYESKGLKKDGTTFDVEIRGKATRYGGRSVRVTALRDITERKRAEEKLKESEERFRSAFEDAPIGVALVGLDGRRFRLNRALCEMLGYSEDELLCAYLEHVHPDDRESSSEHLRRLLEEGAGSYDLERRYLHADRHTVWNLTSVSLIQDSQGNPSHLVCLHQDITERKEAEEKLRESEERFRSLVQNASDVITVLDEVGTIRYESLTVERVLGYLPEERVGKNAFDYLHPDDEERSKAAFAEALDNPGEVRPLVEFRLRHKDGSWRHMETTRTNLLDDPAVKGVVANSRDITERKRAEEKIRESEERYRAVVEQSAEAIWLFDPDTKRVLESNTAFQEMLGYTAEELKEMTNYDFITNSRENVDSAVERIVQEGRGFFGERKYRRKDGMVLDVEVSGSVIPYDGKEVVCAVARDLTERKELEEQLRHQAFHDSLTELPNRALFLDRLGHALARARREDGPVAVLLLDLNDFKVVNDSLGHDAGNAVLVEIAKRLRKCMRPGDTTARIFGDEFAVLLEAPSGMEDASRVADRLQEGLQEPFDVDGREMFVSASIGIALGESPEAQPEEVLRHADLAMYEAKRRGRVEYEVYKPSMNTRAVNRMDLQNELRRAVEREEFEVYYQPLIELETDSVAGFEALARWRHPERGLVDAEEFIELAEETGLIRPIGQRVLEEACRQAKEWRERYPDKMSWMSVNFSASQFSRQPDLIPKVLGEIGLEPSALLLEITERAVMDNAEYSIGKLKKLKGQGVSFAIDDYGMGYSCLYYLKRMPVDFLKIDRSFITGLGQDRGDEAIVFGTIGLAHALNLKVVAEGVETEEQLAKLKELGCDLAQGFYLAEPLPSEDSEKLLQERDSF